MAMIDNKAWYIGNIQEKINIPIIHIADVTANKIKEQGINSVGLIGTSYTMEQDFYTSRLESNGIKVIVPNANEREIVNKIIFEELCLGKVKQPSRNYYKKVIRNLIETGAEGIILGCTEIESLIKPEDSKVPLFNTTYIHALEAVNISLRK